MFEQIDSILYKLRFVFAGILIAASVALLVVIMLAIGSSMMQSFSDDGSGGVFATNVSDTPNAVASGLGSAASGFGQAMNSTGRTISNDSRTALAVMTRFGLLLAHGGFAALHYSRVMLATTARGVGWVLATAMRGVGFGILCTMRGVSDGIVFVLRIPDKTFGMLTHAPVVSGIIQPSEHSSEHDQVPIIDPHSPELVAARAALPAAKSTSKGAAVSSTPQWPIHGVITTLFGVPEMPYEAIHTGLDISDGAAPGVTPVHPFRPGRVKEVLHSGNLGLGNHIVIDHGNGVTSVYGHLNSTAVQVGQQVTKNTILGFEGTTGVSTGVHLHFEIRVNGQATDPHQFISGQP